MIKKLFKRLLNKHNEERYLIYKGSGGLFHNLTALSRAIKMAEKQNRKLVIDMKKHVAFPFDFSTFFSLKMKYTEDYSEIKSEDPLELKRIQESKFKQFKNIKINAKEKIIVFVSSGGGTIDKRIKVNSTIMEKLKLEEKINEAYIAVHFRNTDRKNDVLQYTEKIKKLRESKNINLLYIASDDFYAYEIMKKHLGDMKIIRKVIPEKDVKNLHYHSKDKHKQIYESLLDIYFILHSDFFIPSYNSGYSKGIIKMLEHNNYLFSDFDSQTKIIS